MSAKRLAFRLFAASRLESGQIEPGIDFCGTDRQVTRDHGDGITTHEGRTEPAAALARTSTEDTPLLDPPWRCRCIHTPESHLGADPRIRFEKSVTNQRSRSGILSSQSELSQVAARFLRNLRRYSRSWRLPVEKIVRGNIERILQPTWQFNQTLQILTSIIQSIERVPDGGGLLRSLCSW